MGLSTQFTSAVCLQLKFRWLELVDRSLSLLLLFYPFPSLPVSCSLSSVQAWHCFINIPIPQYYIMDSRACALHFPLFCNQHYSSTTIFTRCLRFDYMSSVVARYSLLLMVLLLFRMSADTQSLLHYHICAGKTFSIYRDSHVYMTHSDGMWTLHANMPLSLVVLIISHYTFFDTNWQINASPL